MKIRLLYLLLSLFLLFMFSCRSQDSRDHQQDNLQTDSFVYEEDIEETEKNKTFPFINSVEFNSGYEYVIPEMKDELDSCISPALRECIVSYIDRYDPEGIDVYYCVHFFKKGTNSYFTIWLVVHAPKGRVECYYPGIAFRYYWFIMHKKEIVLIFNPNSDQLLPFSPCINQLGDLDAKYLPDSDPCMIQERSFYRTYKYIRQDNDFYIEPLKDTIYMGNNPYLGYEIRLLKRENGLPED